VTQVPTLRLATRDDIEAVVALHQAAAAKPDGLARRPDEVTRDYVEHALTAPGAVSIVAVGPDGSIWGEIHGRRESVALFAHVLSSLTVAVHPDRQGLGIGSSLFEALIAMPGRWIHRSCGSSWRRVRAIPGLCGSMSASASGRKAGRSRADAILMAASRTTS